MLSDTASKASDLRSSRQLSGFGAEIFSRKIWLPKLLYAALPLFYLLSGIISFLATLYVNHWLWILPHYLLFSAACVHMGFLIYRRRRRARLGNN